MPSRSRRSRARAGITRPGGLRALPRPARAARGAGRRARARGRSASSPSVLPRDLQPATRATCCSRRCAATWRRCRRTPHTWRLVLMPPEGAPRRAARAHRARARRGGGPARRGVGPGLGPGRRVARPRARPRAAVSPRRRGGARPARPTPTATRWSASSRTRAGCSTSCRSIRALMSDTGIELTLAINDYDHVRDLVTGRVQVEGVQLTALTLSVEEIFFRFTQFREWDISELSLGKYSSLRAAGDESLVGIPVFPSRVFRHSGDLRARGRGRRRAGAAGRPADRRAGVGRHGRHIHARHPRPRVRRRARRAWTGTRAG